MANASMQALQAHAEKLNQQVAEVNASIKALGNVPDDSPALQEYRKQLRRLNSDLKDVNTTMKDYTRGVKAAGELYRHYAMGNIEDMSIKAIRAGVNGMKKRLDNLKAGGDPGDAEEMRLIEAITTEADVVVKRFKTDYQHVVEEITRGGTVTEQTLKRTRDGLADLMQTAETEAEKNELTNYWQKVGAAIEAVAVENRRLRGEVADREEAMRIAYATDHDGSQQAIHDAEARADAARRENDELRQRLDLKQQQRRELEQEMDINSMQQRALMDRRDELKAQEKEDRAIRNQRVDDANKELNAARRAAKTQQQAYDEQKQTVEKLRTEVHGLTDDIRKMGEVKAEPKIDTSKLTRLQEEYNQKVERRKQLEQELQAIQTASYNDDPKVKQLKAEIEKIEELIAVSDKYRKQFTKMSDEKFDEGFKGKDESRRSIWEARKYLDDAYNDKLLKAPLANMDLPDADKYKDAAKRVAEGIVQNAQENVRRVIFEQIKDGRWTPEVMEENLQSMRNMMNNAGNSELGLKDNPEYQAYKYIVAQMERYLEVAKQVQAEREKIAGSEPFLKATQQDDYEHGIYPEGLSRQVEKREFQDLTGWRSWKAENDDREGRKSVELAKAQDEESESLGRLNKAKKESAEQTAAQSASSEQLAQKQEQLSQKTAELNQQQDKLNGMVDETVTANQRLARAEQEQTDARNAQAEAKKHEGEAVKKVEDELRGLTDEQLKNAQAYSHLTEEINADTAAMQRNITTEQEATREADRLRSGSIDKMEQALARLRESNRKLDPTIDKEEWERGERAIGQLNLRLEELKKQSAELRREPVLDMMTQRMQSLSTLSRDALTETKKFWEQMVDGAQKGSTELADYEQHLKSIALEEQARVREKGREAFAFFQSEDYRHTNAANTEEQRKALVAYRDTIPVGDTRRIEEINALLEKHAQFVKEAAGEWMSLEKAMELASKAGTDQFAGSAKDIQLATQSLERQRDTIIATIREKRNLGQATKAEEDQLADLTKKLRSLKFEQDNVNMSQEKMRTLIETPANAVNLDELRAAIKRADGQLRQMQQSLGTGSDEYKRFAEQVRQAKNVMKEMEGQAKASATAWEKAFSRLKTYVVMYMGFNEVWQKVTGTASDLMDLSDRMGEVRKTTGFTADEVGRLSENLKKMDVRTSLTSLMEISASAGQLGLKTLEDVQGFTEAANKLMIALPEMGREAATEMMRVAIATGEVDKIRKQLQEGTIEGSSATAVAMEKIASTIDRLRASSASTAPEITDFVKRVGAVGAQSGITIDQVAALGSTVSSLGMRIEMSATALSRMIPAIRNNAFELAKAIGVTPDTIRNLFDTGRGMEVILMILQRIKDTGMDADSVEQMLGMAGMRDIMKDLNQQGARAGIVFSGLSQNVDELRRQLGVAGEAYEENIAIQQEFDKMNETTAAKWERLKNAFEEAFVSDNAQRFLGTVIDGLRKIVDLLMGGGGLTTALATISTLVLVLKTNIIGIMWNAIALGLARIIDLFKNWRIALDLVILKLRALTLAQWANVFVAAASAVAMLVYSLRNAANAMSETSKAMGEVEKQLHKQMTAANKLFRSLAKVREQERVAALAAKEQAKAETEKGKAVEQSADKTDKLSKETDKLAGSEKKAAEQTAKVEEGMKRVNAEGKESARIIREINSKYGAYLGYMLSETASARQLAEARELINKKLRETITLKQKEAALSDIEQEYGGKVRKGASSTDDLIASYFGSNDEAYARVSVAVSEAAQKYAKDQKKFQAEVQKIVMANRQFISQSAKKDFRDAYAQSGRGASDNEIVSSIASNIGARAESYRASVEEYQKQVETAERVFDARANVLRKESRESAVRTLNSIMADWKDALARYQKAEGDEKEKLAVEVYKQQRSYNNLFANNADYFTNDKRKGTIERSIENMKSYEKGLRQVADESIRAVDAAERAESKIQNTDFTNGNEGSGNSPWGTSERADSTTYTEMTAEQLVNRREQMNKFVNSIQTDTDVKAVLNEDKALKKAIEAGMSSDMRTVIEWYNTERLKIQDELHARHLTNTGDWLDPKKERGAKKQFRDEMDAYLHELDAYYTERKTRIEEAGTDEGLTEAEIRNRTLANEMEWQQRRAELQKLYSRKQKEVTQEELNAIYHIISERTGDTESFVKAQIAKTNQFVDAIEKSGDKGAAIVHRWMSQVELDTERSYLKGQQALTKQMKAIEDIIDKERPFNGITKQLRESLSTMDILTGDMRKEYDELMKAGKDMRDFNERQGRAELQRTSFLLGEAEQAYSTTIDRVMQQMREKGMGQWADWFSVRPEQQEALMAQLRQTYDAIQDAIKKEASQLKKQAEIMWNNILVPGGDGKTTMKQMLDRTVAQLGIDQGRVSRANSLIGAGVASDRVADKLAIQQMRLQLTMQEHYYNLMKKQGRAHVDMLNQQADAAERRGNAEEATRKRLDAQHAEMALNLATAKEETELAKQREEIIARTEESQNRLYTELRSWADLLTSSLQGVFEASHAGDAEYYNERAKLNLTGKGGPGAGTYVVIDDAGTSDATAHYEHLDERQALERQHEIEVQNAQAEAWRKLMDDLNMKMSETITDQLNALLQNSVIDANTQAVIKNTEALYASMGAAGGSGSGDGYKRNAEGFAVDEQGQIITPVQPTGETPSGEGVPKAPWQMTDEEVAKSQENMGLLWQTYKEQAIAAETEKAEMLTELPGYVPSPLSITDEQIEATGEKLDALKQKEIDASIETAQAKMQAQEMVKKSEQQNDQQMVKTNKSSFAAMTAAANMYGIAYQTMSNDNLDTSQKVQMMIVQAAGQAAISMLTASMAASTGETAANAPSWISKTLKELGPIGGPVAVGVFTALIGGLMGLATSKIAKSKSEIAQATGASVGAGRLATGMLTYAEGNVNELTDPASLTPGRQYNVDGADGKTYRAKYMGKGAKTHITNGPEFHLVGEAGREAIIDAKTTRLLQMNDTGIWRDIQTLYNGGSIAGLSTRRRRGTGMPAFADGNVGEFEDMSGDAIVANGTGLGFDPIALQSSLDANTAVQQALLERLNQPIVAVNKWTGSDGIPAMYNKMQKEAQRHGENYL